VIRQDGAIVGEHRRRFGRGETIYDPWHYVPVLARKPGALRNGAPFKDWLLPASLERMRLAQPSNSFLERFAKNRGKLPILRARVRARVYRVKIL
jgi:hypothetical protein